MASLTDYTENALLEHLIGGVAFPQPAGLYLGLFTADPTDAGLVVDEISGNAYVRQVISFGAVAGGQVPNNADIVFPAADPAAWGLITHAAIFDAVSAGNMLQHAPLAVSKQIDIGDIFKINIGELIMSLD